MEQGGFHFLGLQSFLFNLFPPPSRVAGRKLRSGKVLNGPQLVNRLPHETEFAFKLNYSFFKCGLIKDVHTHTLHVRFAMYDLSVFQSLRTHDEIQKARANLKHYVHTNIIRRSRTFS